MVTVKAWGTGRPDYSKYIAKGLFRKSIGVLKSTEKKKVFALCYSTKSSIFPYVVTGTLAPNTEVHLIDTETGLAMPYTVPAGYDLEIIKYWGSANAPVRGRLFIDGVLSANFHFVDYSVYFEQEVGLAKISDIDPTLSSSHTIDITIENMGGSGAIGYAEVLAILKKVGSEEIKDKEVKCPFCGATKRVPLSTTKVICPNGHLFIVRAYEFGKE
mgnify:CR=1 FL=1